MILCVFLLFANFLNHNTIPISGNFIKIRDFLKLFFDKRFKLVLYKSKNEIPSFPFFLPILNRMSVYFVVVFDFVLNPTMLMYWSLSHQYHIFVVVFICTRNPVIYINLRNVKRIQHNTNCIVRSTSTRSKSVSQFSSVALEPPVVSKQPRRHDSESSKRHHGS